MVSAVLLGIVNVTPDSFSDGGQFYDVQDAFDHCKPSQEILYYKSA